MSLTDDTLARTGGASASGSSGAAAHAWSDGSSRVRPVESEADQPQGGVTSRVGEAFDRWRRSPSLSIPRPGKPPMHLSTDRVRASPALSPQVSMVIGATALGLGMWGTFFPKSVQSTLGVKGSNAAVRGLFGVRELASGVTLLSDPSRADVLWMRAAADIFDIAVLRALDKPENPQRGAARIALGMVLAVTALDIGTAVRMSTVRRNCA